MNTLSWMLYLSDVVGGINGPTEFGTFIFAGLALLLTVLYIYSVSENMEFPKALTTGMKWVYTLFFVFLIVQAIVPSRETVLLIAASEIGEDVVNSPEMLKLREILLDKLEQYEPTQSGE